MATIPSNAVLIKKGMKTKEVYFKKEEAIDFFKELNSLGWNDTQINNLDDKVYIKLTKEMYGGWQFYVISNENGSDLKDSPCSMNAEGGWYVYERNPIILKNDDIITMNFDASKYIYCIPYAPPPEFPQIDKLPTNATLTETVNKNIEVKNKIDACKNKLAYIINSYNVIASPEEKLSSLINKISELEIIKIPTISNLKEKQSAGGYDYVTVMFDIKDYNNIFPVIISYNADNGEKNEVEISKKMVQNGDSFEYRISNLTRYVNYTVQIKIKNNVSNELIIRLSGTPEIEQ